MFAANFCKEHKRKMINYPYFCSVTVLNFHFITFYAEDEVLRLIENVKCFKIHFLVLFSLCRASGSHISSRFFLKQNPRWHMDTRCTALMMSSAFFNPKSEIQEFLLFVQK